MAEENINSPLLFDTLSRTINPGKILSEKTWSIADLRAFDGIREKFRLRRICSSYFGEG
jgi:hypothetical protein